MNTVTGMIGILIWPGELENRLIDRPQSRLMNEPRNPTLMMV